MPDTQWLEELLGPPRDEVVPVPWDRAPAEVGFQFPTLYRQLIDRYGHISINDELHIAGPSQQANQPGAPTGFEGFVYQTTDPHGFCGYLAHCYAEGKSDECPYPVYPTAGGILKWANDSESDHVFWLTGDDDPDRWPVVVVYRSGFEWERFDGGTADFLRQILTGECDASEELLGGPLGANGPAWTVLGDWSGWVSSRDRKA